MQTKYYVVVGAIVGGILGALVAKTLDIHMGLTTVFGFGLGFLVVERQIRDNLPK